jgi:hypothetical protein
MTTGIASPLSDVGIIPFGALLLAGVTAPFSGITTEAMKNETTATAHIINTDFNV